MAIEAEDGADAVLGVDLDVSRLRQGQVQDLTGRTQVSIHFQSVSDKLQSISDKFHSFHGRDIFSFREQKLSIILFK